MIQDRLFDTNGQLRFPDGANTDADLNGPPTNPLTHPFWIPEFFGDAMVVNGKTWPTLAVEPRRYRFRFVNACNARFLRMNLTDTGQRVVRDAALGGAVLADRHRRRPAGPAGQAQRPGQRQRAQAVPGAVGARGRHHRLLRPAGHSR